MPYVKTDVPRPSALSTDDTQWLGVLEMTAQILIVAPLYENLGKRLINSPKLFRGSGPRVPSAGHRLGGGLANSSIAGNLSRVSSRARLDEARKRNAQVMIWINMV